MIRPAQKIEIKESYPIFCKSALKHFKSILSENLLPVLIRCNNQIPICVGI